MKGREGGQGTKDTHLIATANHAMERLFIVLGQHVRPQRVVPIVELLLVIERLHVHPAREALHPPPHRSAHNTRDTRRGKREDHVAGVGGPAEVLAPAGDVEGERGARVDRVPDGRRPLAQGDLEREADEGEGALPSQSSAFFRREAQRMDGT